MKSLKQLFQSQIENLKQRYQMKNFRFSLVILVTILSIIGVFIVGSAREDYQFRQLQGVLLGLVVMFIVSLINYSWILKFYWLMYVVNIFMLIAVLLFGEEVNGATRWLNLGFIQFQPSDLTKIILILFFARFLSDREERVSDKKTIIQAVALLVPSLILVFKQPNLSNTICLAMLFCVLMYIAGLNYKFIGTVLAIAIPTITILFIIVIQPNQPLIKEYQQTRILAWLYPEEYESEEAYQQLNSIMAIGSGKLTGKGYDTDSTVSVKNGNFISEPQTDFIFAIIGEELGFVGCCVIIILILLIVIDCILIGRKAKDTAGKIICCGVGGLIGIQTFINIGVATMTLPNTGISLPFVSYGLTSIVCLYIGIGLVLNVGLQPKK